MATAIQSASAGSRCIWSVSGFGLRRPRRAFGERRARLHGRGLFLGRRGFFRAKCLPRPLVGLGRIIFDAQAVGETLIFGALLGVAPRRPLRALDPVRATLAVAAVRGPILEKY